MLTALAHVAAVLALGACWALAGFALLPRRARGDEPLFVWSSAFALGTGVATVAMTAASAAGVMTPAAVWAIHAALLPLAVRGALLARAQARRVVLAPPGRGRAMIAAALAVVVGTCLIATLAPPSSMDALVYHLRVPRDFLAAGRWVPLPGVLQGYQPLYVDLLFGVGLAFGSDVLGALVHWALGVAAIGAAGAWARRLGGSALLAMGLFGTMALFAWESTSAFIDLGLALYASLAILWATRSELGRGGIVTAGVLAGLAAGSKLTGGFAAVLAGLAAVSVAWPDARTGTRRLLAIGALAFAIALPWYVRTALYTGNPFYPIANRLFGLPSVPFATYPYGYGSDVLHLLTAPLDLLWRGEAFDKGWAIGPGYLAFVPIGILATARSRAGAVAAGAILSWWVFWFYTSPQTRFLLPVLPIAAGLAAVGAQYALASGSRVARAGVVGVFVVSIGMGLATAAVSARANVRVALGLESREVYLRRMSWHYAAFEAANQRLPPDARVAVVGGGANNFYYLKRPAMHFPEEPNAAEIRGFTHALRLPACAQAPARSGPGEVLWTGRYPLILSRSAGGVRDEICAELVRLPGGR